LVPWNRFRNSSAVIMKMAYGYQITENDPLLQLAEESALISGWALAPGKWLVDYYPICEQIFCLVLVTTNFFKSTVSTFMVSVCKIQESRSGMETSYGPFLRHSSWMGQRTNGNKVLAHLHILLINTILGIWKLCWVFHLQTLKTNQVSNRGKWSRRHYQMVCSRVTCRSSRHCKSSALSIDNWSAYDVRGCNNPKTVSAMTSFILLMALHPGVQKRAQAELNDCIGANQMPRVPDLMKLRYLNAVMKEVLRYAPVGNLGGHMFVFTQAAQTHNVRQLCLTE